MNRFLLLAALAVSVLLPRAALAADVGVSVTIGQPGFYGTIDIGGAPPPQLIFVEPVVVQPYPVTVVRRPMYMRVPPGHEKNWSKHCHKYGACGYPVYFVRDSWYNEVYVPHYRKVGGHGHGHGDDDHGKHGHKDNGKGKGKGKGKDKD